MKKILLLSGYDAASHRYWRKLLADRLSQYQWTQLALADRNYAWRIRGSSFNFAFQHSAEISKQYDLVIATSMVDFSSLRGFVPSLANIPSIIYFHENQFAYPLSDSDNNFEQSANAVNAQLTSIYSALCADKIIFNSSYNLNTFIAGARQLLKRLPEKFPDHLLTKIEEKSLVIAVPIEASISAATRADSLKQANKIPHIVWNHRWEYDKQPKVFFDALLNLKASGYLFRLHVLGQSFRNVPDCFAQAQIDFVDEIESFGYQAETVYQSILDKSDIVVSTALHDFQGLSIMQAISKGCLPIVPDRVAYPEYVPAANLYKTSENPVEEAIHLFNKLVEVLGKSPNGSDVELNVSQYHEQNLVPVYQQVFESLMS